jgi:hypothetical protein
MNLHIVSTSYVVINYTSCVRGVRRLWVFNITFNNISENVLLLRLTRKKLLTCRDSLKTLPPNIISSAPRHGLEIYTIW